MKYNINNHARKKTYFTICCLISFNALAAEDISTPQIVRQEQRLNELQKQSSYENSTISPKIKESNNKTKIIVNEDSCFKINQLKFIIDDPLEETNQKKFNFLFFDLSKDDFIIGKCIGTQSLQNIITYTQNELIKKGYITSQVIVNEQDLSQGLLILNLQVGRIHKILAKDKSVSKLEIFNAFPIDNNDVLRLPKIEQGLENLKSVSRRKTEIKIEPALADDGKALNGYSDLVITSKQDKKFGLNLGFDNSGTKSTGRYLGNIGLVLNNPLHINDSFNINLSHSLDNWNKDLNKSFYASYNIPFKNYNLLTSYNEYTFEQNTPGYYGPIAYIGKTKQTNITLSRLISRSTSYKTSLYIKGYHKTNRNTYGGINLVSQQRTTTGFNIGIQHHQYLGDALLDMSLDYRKGVGALDAERAPEERILDINNKQMPVQGYARAPLWSADIRYSQPFAVFKHPVLYRLNWRGQYAPKILVPQDRFYIAGRYSVRGFDGDLSLSGDNGQYLQHEFSWNSPIPATQFYTGLDQGWVNGRNSIAGNRHLIGSVIGTRSYLKNVYLETFVGHGIQAPKMIKKQWVTGFSLNFSY
jgi:hemolysin activation/secretion protein